MLSAHDFKSQALVEDALPLRSLLGRERDLQIPLGSEIYWQSHLTWWFSALSRSEGPRGLLERTKAQPSDAAQGLRLCQAQEMLMPPPGTNFWGPLCPLRKQGDMLPGWTPLRDGGHSRPSQWLPASPRLLCPAGRDNTSIQLHIQGGRPQAGKSRG